MRRATGTNAAKMEMQRGKFMVAAAAAGAAGVLLLAATNNVARADMLISADWPENPPTEDGWYRIAGFTDYASGQTPANGAGITRVDQGGDFKLQYVNANGQYWGQIVGQSWANPAITVPNMQANPVLEFDLDLSQANWGNLTLRTDVESKGTSTGDVAATLNTDLSHLTVKNRGTNPIVQHVSIDLSQLSTPIQNIENGTGDQNLLLFFQPGYYGFWDSTANGGAGAWVDAYVTQTYLIDNMYLTTGPAKVNGAWNADADGNFSDAAQWAGGVPGGAGHTANFGATLTGGGPIAPRTITADTPVTLGVLNFYNPNSQTIVGPGAITLTGASTVAAAINVADGNHVVSAPLNLSADTTVTVSPPGGMLTLSNLNAAGVTVTKKGAGTLAVPRLRAGGLDVVAGTVAIAQNGAAAGASQIGTLNIAATGKLDLKDNKLITTTPAGTVAGGVYSGVQGLVQRAYNFGAWDMPGLTTSMPEAGFNAGILSGTTTVGVATAEQVLFIGATDTALFMGLTVTGASTIAMYTYAGDLNFDGLVDGADYGVIDNYVQFPGTDGYANGDFNYDGVIDGADYGIIDNTIQLQGEPFPTGAGAAMAGVTAVPEPGSVAGAVLAAGAMLHRRGRRRRR